MKSFLFIQVVHEHSTYKFLITFVYRTIQSVETRKFYIHLRMPAFIESIFNVYRNLDPLKEVDVVTLIVCPLVLKIIIE